MVRHALRSALHPACYFSKLYENGGGGEGAAAGGLELDMRMQSSPCPASSTSVTSAGGKRSSARMDVPAQMNPAGGHPWLSRRPGGCIQDPSGLKYPITAARDLGDLHGGLGRARPPRWRASTLPSGELLECRAGSLQRIFEGMHPYGWSADPRLKLESSRPASPQRRQPCASPHFHHGGEWDPPLQSPSRRRLHISPFRRSASWSPKLSPRKRGAKTKRGTPRSAVRGG